MGVISDWFRKTFEGDIPQNPNVPKPVPAPPRVVTVDVVRREHKPYDPNKPTLAVGNALLPDGDAMQPIGAKKETLNAILKRASGSLSGKRIAIIVGHEKQKPGAILQHGPWAGMAEYGYNSKLAYMIATALWASDATGIVIFRDHIGIIGAYEKARASRADFVVELHFNSSADARANGCETLISSVKTSASKKEELFAIYFANAINDIGGLAAGKKRHGNGILQVLREDRGGVNVNALVDIPCALIEPFFGSHSASCALWGSEYGQKKIADAVLHGLTEAIGTRTVA